MDVRPSSTYTSEVHEISYRAEKITSCTAQKMKSSIKDFFSKCDQIRSFLRIWSHLLKESLMENFIFCAVLATDEGNFRKLDLFV